MQIAIEVGKKSKLHLMDLAFLIANYVGMSKQRVDGLMIEHLIYILFKLLDISLNCLWNSKRYCKDPLHALATMKITKKKQEMRKI
jgi:hypothetical protein